MGIYINLIGIYFGSKTSKVTSEEIAYLENMHIIPETELNPKDYKRDKLYGRILMASGILISAVMVIFWAIPYMKAV